MTALRAAPQRQGYGVASLGLTAYGLGAGVGRGLVDGPGRAVGDGLGVDVGVAVAVAVTVAVGVAVAVAVAVAVGGGFFVVPARPVESCLGGGSRPGGMPPDIEASFFLFFLPVVF